MSTEERQPRRIPDFVPWGIFYAVVGIIITVFGIAVGSIQAKVLKIDSEHEGLLVQLAQMQTDIRNQNALLLEVRQDVKALR